MSVTSTTIPSSRRLRVGLALATLLLMTPVGTALAQSAGDPAGPARSRTSGSGSNSGADGAAAGSVGESGQVPGSGSDVGQGGNTSVRSGSSGTGETGTGMGGSTGTGMSRGGGGTGRWGRPRRRQARVVAGEFARQRFAALCADISG